jgi:hypothetical protein
MVAVEKALVYNLLKEGGAAAGARGGCKSNSQLPQVGVSQFVALVPLG